MHFETSLFGNWTAAWTTLKENQHTKNLRPVPDLRYTTMKLRWQFAIRRETHAEAQSETRLACPRENAHSLKTTPKIILSKNLGV